MIRPLRQLFIGIFLAVFCANSFAVVELVSFDTPAQEEQYKRLIAELRCVVCQNQNLADSDAPLAKDLRSITADLIKQGKSNAEIKSFMRQRYGDFVLYRPPLTPATAFLWIGPVIVLIIALLVILLRTKRRTETELLHVNEGLNQDARIKIRNLINEAPPLDGRELTSELQPDSNQSESQQDKGKRDEQ